MSVDMLKHRRFALLLIVVLFIFFTLHYYRELSPRLPANSKYSSKSSIDQIAHALKKKNISFKILVYGWKRRASLRRLLDSLCNVNYRGFDASLEIHIEGDYHPLVIQYVNNFTWPHGTSIVKKRRYKAGLENNIVESWDPKDDREFALMFEDDIEVHKGYFDYVLTCLHKHVFTGPHGSRDIGYHTNHLFGISLTTPRYDETSIPRKAWTPDEQIGGQEPFFLFQMACSWGALYFPWTWRRYLAYYKWRTAFTLPKKIDVIPFSYVNIWERSWKRYLQELMFMTGGVMLYPNFANQTSFSTHHREVGEHTQGKGAVPLVDALGTNNKPIFSVPLLPEDFDVESVLFGMKALADLPVVNFYHNRTADLQACRELGVGSADVLREFGLDLAAYNRNPTCILDWANPLYIPKSAGNGRKMTFIPQGSHIIDQMDQLRNAIAISHSLSRPLIVPDFRVDDNQTVSMDGILNISLPKPFKIVREPLDIGKVKRLVAFHNFDSQGNLPADPTGLPPQNILHNTTRHIKLPISHGTDHDLQRWFAGCNDDILLFTNVKNAFSQYVDLHENGLFEDILAHSMTLTDKLDKILSQFKQRLGTKYICVEYHKPDPHFCRKPKYDYKYWRSLHHRSCKASLLKTAQYGHSWTRQLPELRDCDSMYIINGTTEAIPLTISTAGDLMSVFTARDFDSVDAFVLPLLEEQLCAEADFFLGNTYSPMAKRIVDRRRRARRLTALTGMGVVEPYRNVTLPGAD